MCVELRIYVYYCLCAHLRALTPHQRKKFMNYKANECACTSLSVLHITELNIY